MLEPIPFISDFWQRQQPDKGFRDPNKVIEVQKLE